MDTKKILVAVALFALVATPAFAFFPMFGGSEVEVENENSAFVMNDVEAKADTGDNEIEGGRRCSGGCCGGGCGSGGVIITGDAGSLATAINYVNTNITRIRR